MSSSQNNHQENAQKVPDFYALLQIHPNSTPREIADAWCARTIECSEDDSLTYETRSQKYADLGRAWKSLMNGQTRIIYDIIYLMQTGKLSLTNSSSSSSPQPDYPSKGVATWRAGLAYIALQKAVKKVTYVIKCVMVGLEEARNTATPLRITSQYIAVLERLVAFDEELQYARFLAGDALAFLQDPKKLKSPEQWAREIRDPRPVVTEDGEDEEQDGMENESRVSLKGIQEAERKMHKFYWPQVADALLRKIDESEDMTRVTPVKAETLPHLQEVLGHVRWE